MTFRTETNIGSALNVPQHYGNLEQDVEELFKRFIEQAINDPQFYAGGLVIALPALMQVHRDIKTGNIICGAIEGNATTPEARLESGTVERKHTEPDDIGSQIDKLLNTAREVTFEKGLGAEFYDELESIIKAHGENAILALYYRMIMISKHFDPEIAAETLNWLGTIECSEADTYHLRLWLLEEALKHPSPWVREGATIGLSRLNDPDAIPYLKTALEKEQRPLLRKLMNKTITRLEQTHNAAVSKGHNQPL